MTTRPALTLLTACTLALGAAAAPTIAVADGGVRAAKAGEKQRKGKPVHNGTYTCYQGGLTSEGSMYWGTLEVRRGSRYAITGSTGSFRRSGSRLVWTSGSLKKWKWEGRYRTSRTPDGKRQFHVEIIDRPNEIRITCSD